MYRDLEVGFSFANGWRGRWWNSVWILVPAVEGNGPPCCNGCVGFVATRVLLEFYYIKWLSLYCPILCDWVWKLNEGFPTGLFYMCLGFHCPICDSIRCDSEVTFRVVSYVLFLGLLMLQRRKYGRSFVMFFLFVNVRLLLCYYCYGYYCALWICWSYSLLSMLLLLRYRLSCVMLRAWTPQSTRGALRTQQRNQRQRQRQSPIL
jgi:hypothetical protein